MGELCRYVLILRKGSSLSLFQSALASHPSLSEFDQQSLFEQTPRIEHSGESSGNPWSGLIDKQLHPAERGMMGGWGVGGGGGGGRLLESVRARARKGPPVAASPLDSMDAARWPRWAVRQCLCQSGRGRWRPPFFGYGLHMPRIAIFSNSIFSCV